MLRQYNVELGVDDSNRVWYSPAHAVIRGSFDRTPLAHTATSEDVSGTASAKIYQLDDQDDEPASFASRSGAKRSSY
jgi:hypothetical protein